MHDKEHTVLQKVNESGPGADASLIRREVLELGDVPNRWRSWGKFIETRETGAVPRASGQSPFLNVCIFLTTIQRLVASFSRKENIPPKQE